MWALTSLSNIIFEKRADAMTYNKFINWWTGQETPFNIDKYKIMGIHL